MTDARRLAVIAILTLAVVALALHGAAFRAAPPATDVLGAAAEGDIEAVRQAVERDPGAVRARDGGGFTPLHRAVDGYQYDEVTFLVEHGADLEARGADGVTPLVAAAQKGHLRIAAFLLERGARIDGADDAGWTPLHWAVYFCDEDMADLLIRRQASATARDRSGQTPLDLARRLGPPGLVARLGGTPVDPAPSTDVFELARNGRHVPLGDAVEQRPALGKQRDPYGWNIALWLVRKQHGGLATKYPGGWKEPGPEGISALQMVVQQGDPFMVTRAVEDEDVVIDGADAQGRTPLHWAILLRDAASAETLIAAGADIRLRDARGRTPLTLARAYGLDSVAATLAARGGKE